MASAIDAEILDQLKELNKSLAAIGATITGILTNLQHSMLAGMKILNDTLKANNTEVLTALAAIDEDLLLTGGSNPSSVAEDLTGIGELKSIYNNIKEVVKTVIGVVTKIYGKITRAIQSSIDLGRQLSALNSQLATTFAISDVKKIFRDIKLGQLTSQSTTSLVQAVDDLKDALVPITADFINLFNFLATKLVQFITGARQLFIDFRDFVLKILDTIPWFKELHDEILKWLRKQDQPGNFPIQNAIDQWAKGNAGKFQQPLFPI